MLKLTSKSLPGYNRILKRITASGLSRVLEHMWKGDFAILSASIQQGNDHERTHHLKHLLKDEGYGFIDLKGGYLYEGTNVPVQEDSVFIPNISEENARKLAEMFDQESYIIGQRGDWNLKSTETQESWATGNVEETFEPLRDKEVGKDFPYMSQVRGRKGHQFRLDTELPERKKRRQEEYARQQRQEELGRVAFRLVDTDGPCFFSTTGNFRPHPPVALGESGIHESGKCPDASLLDCWLPLIR